MKRVFLSLLLTAAVLLSACSGQEEAKEPTAPPSQLMTTEYPAEPAAGIAAIDHCAVEPDERAAMSDSDRAQYRRLMDAMLGREERVTLDTQPSRMDFLLELLHESPYYFFTSDVRVSGTTVAFTYAFSAREQQEMLDFMDGELLGIANSSASPEDNALDTILKIYAAVGGRISYDTEREDNKQLGSPLFDYPADELYKALRDGRSLCYGFAYVMRYALLQRGIDAFCVYGECTARGMAHEWVIFCCDGSYFHCDPAWDRGEGTAKLLYFGATDRERALDTLMPRDFADYHDPAYGVVVCDDERFSVFRGIVSYFSLGAHRFLLEDRKGNRTVFNTEDFSVKDA